jgi:hypothetical protein
MNGLNDEQNKTITKRWKGIPDKLESDKSKMDVSG